VRIQLITMSSSPSNTHSLTRKSALEAILGVRLGDGESIHTNDLIEGKNQGFLGGAGSTKCVPNLQNDGRVSPVLDRLHTLQSLGLFTKCSPHLFASHLNIKITSATSPSKSDSDRSNRPLPCRSRIQIDTSTLTISPAITFHSNKYATSFTLDS